MVIDSSDEETDFAAAKPKTPPAKEHKKKDSKDKVYLSETI